MRPDEQANYSEIERDKQFRGNVNKGVSAVASAGALALGSGITSKILPFLNEYVPQELAMKGLIKVSPKVADFLKRGQSMGLDIREGMDFVKDQLTPRENPSDERSVIEKYSPDLFNFLKEQIGKGRNPLEAAAIAQLNDKFKSIIKKIENDNKTNWSSIIESVFGGGQSAQPEEQQSPQGQQQAQGGIDPNLQAIGQKLQQLLQSRGM